MQIARVDVGGTAEFAVRLDGTDWTFLSRLGVRVADTPELIGQWEEIVRLVADQAAQLPEKVPDSVAVSAILCPLVRPSKIFGIGLNYRDHIRETGAATPEEPVIFAKFPNALAGPSDAIVVDEQQTKGADYEAELAVVIGRGGHGIAENDALDAVFGYCAANDVSARDIQAKDPRLSRAKSFDTFCPIGPWITTTDEIGDPGTLRIQSWVNKEARQDSNTRELLFTVPKLIAYLSSTMTLYPGDVILTGTPPGVGFAMDPPVFLAPGDLVTIEIEGLGRIENRVASSAAGSP